jgi:DNA-binding CsgD family transcriptional regulator
MVVRPPEITDEDLNNIPKVSNGHTRKVINRSIMSRRHTLHTLMAKGLNQYQAAAILGCSQETVCNDVAWLRNYYKKNLIHYIENRLPELWESCLTQLHSTMADVAKIAEDPNISTHDKLHAHSLMVDCIKVKEGLISDPTIIKEALDIVDQTKKSIIEISKEKSKELLQNHKYLLEAWRFRRQFPYFLDAR